MILVASLLALCTLPSVTPASDGFAWPPPRPGAPVLDADALSADVDAHWEGHLAGLFEHFHRNPELSFLEHETAARLAAELRALGVEVTEGVGGTGLVGILSNGDGPTVLVRADMDGLPVEERTGLDYASTARQVDITGEEVPVVHACGHDVHMTSMVGTAKQLVRLKDSWSGTVMFVGQPAEERIGGALAEPQRHGEVGVRVGVDGPHLPAAAGHQLARGGTTGTRRCPRPETRLRRRGGLAFHSTI